MGQPTIFPTGVTIYKPEKCWNGYNLVPTINSGALLFDMTSSKWRFNWIFRRQRSKIWNAGWSGSCSNRL